MYYHCCKCKAECRDSVGVLYITAVSVRLSAETAYVYYHCCKCKAECRDSVGVLYITAVSVRLSAETA